MAYKLAANSGETVAVPQVVFRHLARTDGDTVRVALYLVGGGAAEPRTIAHDLGLKSVEAAKRALQYWVGAGLLDRGADAALPENPSPRTRLDPDAINDPFVAVLCQEAQASFGRALSRSEMLRLVSLYLDEGWQPDVILTCCAEIARQPGNARKTVASVCRELHRWREAGVETGADAEKYLQREALRAERRQEVARLFGVDLADFTRWERSAIDRWFEQGGFSAEVIAEAILRAENHRTVRYVDGILRAWHAQGRTTLDAVRGQGQLTGANILATGAKPAASASTAPANDLFHTDWNAIFDDETEV